MRKKLIIIIIALAVIAAGLLFYFFSLKKSPQEPLEPIVPTESPLARPLAISQGKVISAGLAPGGKNIRYYASGSGNIFEVDFLGQNRKLFSDAFLPDILKVLFSLVNQDDVIVITKEGKYYYDLSKGQSSQLHQDIQWIAFSPDGTKIVYQFFSPSSNIISQALPDGQDWINLFETRLEDLIISWPSQEKISLQLPCSGLKKGALYTIDNEGKNFTKILDEIFGLSANWAPSGDKFIFSSTEESGKNLSLTLYEAASQKQTALKSATLAEKCAWSQNSQYLFCAVPQQISSFAVWPDDYKKRALSTEDDFYKIDILADERTKIAASKTEKAFDAKDLFLSPDEKYLFFINQRDGLLYSLEL